jgi:tRNA pseudouridine55 synthase
MATGVLVVGVEKATRLLGHLALTDKSYDATIRLGRSTVTDDADGATVTTTPAGHLTEDEVRSALEAFLGQIEQVPSAVSAVKVDGRRSYARVRAGEAVALPARAVTISRLDVRAFHESEPGMVDVEVSLDCSTGTYVRALARDLGTSLGVGGHLVTLRRTRVGPFLLAQARTLEDLATLPSPVGIPLSAAVTQCFARRDLTADEAAAMAHGRPVAAIGRRGSYGVFASDGEVVALVEERDDLARPLVVFRPAP